MSTEPDAPNGRSPDTQDRKSSSASYRDRRRLVLMLSAPVVLAVLIAAVVTNGMDAGKPRPGIGVAVGTGAVAEGGSQVPGGVTVGAPAPSFEVPTVSDGTFRLPSGQPTILTFINFCPTCIQDVRTIGELQNSFGNVAVLAVATDPTADAGRLRDFVGRAGDFDFALALDPQGALTLRFDASSMAGSVVVADPRGTVTYRGAADPEALEVALREAGATA